jgi:hypothetical protein
VKYPIPINGNGKITAFLEIISILKSNKNNNFSQLFDGLNDLMNIHSIANLIKHRNNHLFKM